jgi:hypothetical protein
MQTPKQAYPLQWPVGYKRTNSRTWSRFKQTPDEAQQFLRAELNRLGATRIIVSSNIAIRNDGMMYADAMKRTKHLEDPGVAVYFDYKGKPVVLCCDTYNQVWENVYAIGKTIENLRAIDRYGVSDFLTRSFTGFAELPESIAPPYKRPWWEVLGVDEDATEEEIRTAFRNLASRLHPDRGGSTEAFQEVAQAKDDALKHHQKAARA